MVFRYMKRNLKYDTKQPVLPFLFFILIEPIMHRSCAKIGIVRAIICCREILEQFRRHLHKYVQGEDQDDNNEIEHENPNHGDENEIGNEDPNAQIVDV